MSCSLTVDAVRARTKTVTRRHVGTWQTLKPGDRLTLIEKGMGLKKGERQVVLAEVEVVDVRVERLGLITHEEIAKEGFADHTGTCHEWGAWWARGHGYSLTWIIGASGMWATTLHEHRRINVDDIPVRRIEWRYLPE